MIVEFLAQAGNVLFSAVGPSTEEITEATTEAVTEIATEMATEVTTQDMINQILNTSEKTAMWSNTLLDYIYIIATLVVVVAFFTAILYIVKFFKNMSDPNYVKNDDEFLDD